MSAFCVLMGVNTRPSAPVALGHIDSENGPGLFVLGSEYGWPWRYRTEAFRYDLVAESVFANFFDDFNWWAITGDIFVGTAIVVATVTLNLVLVLPGIMGAGDPQPPTRHGDSACRFPLQSGETRVPAPEGLRENSPAIYR